MEVPSVSRMFLLLCLVMAVSSSSLKRVKRAMSHREPMGPGRPYFMAHACERNLLEMSCERGLVINIVRVTYGRLTLALCAEGSISTKGWNMQCTASPRRSHGKVASSCNGQTTCIIPAVNHWFGDPCPGTYKYLEVYYACVRGGINNLAVQS